MEGSNRRNAVNYTNVPPGNYVFQLQAANNEGVWNKRDVAAGHGILQRPGGKSWWFYMLSFLVISALVYWLYRIRISQVRGRRNNSRRNMKRSWPM